MGNLGIDLEKMPSLKLCLVTIHQNVNLHYQDKLKQKQEAIFGNKIKISG